MATKGLRAMIADNRAKHSVVFDRLREAEEREKARLPIELMKPGEVPREPGWYVTDIQGIVEVTHGSYQDRTLFVAGVLWSSTVALAACPDMRFIARIYPDRIGEE